MKLQRWRYRQRVFKLGFCGVLFALLLMSIGYLAPAWQNSGGLWMHSHTDQPLPGWLQAVRAVESLSVVLVVVAVVVEVIQDVLPTTPPRADCPLVELLAVTSGVAGMVGVVVFAVEVSGYPPGQGPYGAVSKPLFWAWGLQAVASLAVVLSALVMAHSRAASRGRSERKMAMEAFRRSAPVGLNPYFVTRSAPPLTIRPVGPRDLPDSQA